MSGRPARTSTEISERIELDQLERTPAALSLARQPAVRHHRRAMGKKRALPPRRKRMRRAARLQSARHWLAGYSGKNPIRSYAKWFGVDWMCAVRELEILGVKLDPVYVQQLRTTLDERPKHRKAAKAAKAASEAGVDLDGCGEEWDHEFQFIAGRTSGGAPYGVQWDALPDQQD